MSDAIFRCGITRSIAGALHSCMSVVLFLFMIAMTIDLVLIEPNWIEVTRHEVPGPLDPPLKIAHVTDLHTQGLGYRERSMLALLDREQPDLIVVTGDIIANHHTLETTRVVLERLHAPLGVWVVRGNWENSLRKPVAQQRAYYKAAGATFLLNGARQVREGVWIVGFDDAASGWPELHAALKDIPQGAFTIALFHAPGYFSQVAGHCQLAFAGHTHGGQVRLPFVTPFWLPRGCGRFIAGWYEEQGSRLYVSRGIGMSTLPIRFLCRPELAIITVGTRSHQD